MSYNIYGLLCTANSLDSVFLFADSNSTTPAFVWLTNKAIHSLQQMTISLWMRVSNPTHSGTALSYAAQTDDGVFQIMSGPTVGMNLHGQQAITNVQLEPGKWTHVVFTWSSSGT